MNSFWNKVKKTPTCWEWQGSHSSNGYGASWKDKHFITAHRLSYELHNGEIPKDMCVCHICDNRSCVNPEHLWLGSYKENNQDKLNKGRGNLPKGSKQHMSRFTEEEVLKIRTDSRSQKEIAKEFGVNPATISYIVTRKTWKHI